MSFPRHGKSIDPISTAKLGGTPRATSQRSSGSMSFQPGIPWQVALQQSLPPLRRPETILLNPNRRATIFHRTATTSLTSCLTIGVHPRSQNQREAVRSLVFTSSFTIVINSFGFTGFSR